MKNVGYIREGMVVATNINGKYDKKNFRKVQELFAKLMRPLIWQANHISFAVN